MNSKTSEYQKSQFELLKNPIVAEFLEFRTEDSFSENDLENAILSHIRDFLMEMGRGFAFVSRQQHIVTDTQDYFIDLVFYNIELKCYVLIDLKMGTVTHQDVGQMDMYVRMYDELKRKRSRTESPIRRRHSESRRSSSTASLSWMMTSSTRRP